MIQDKFKFVSSFQEIEKYKKVLAGVSNEREITVRIKELLRYRKNGINNLQESESYEAKREKRNTGEADRKKDLGPASPSQSESRIQMIEMQNGCNCCTIQSDLVEELIGLTQMKNEDKEMKFNYILIEALGISEPHEIARNNWDAERRGIKN